MGSLQSTIMAGLSSLFSLFSTSIKDIGIDLGTANTLVYVRGEGIVLREPSVVAVDANSNEVLAIGKKAKEMLGRTPESITAVRPLKDGVIADFEVTAAMLKYFVRKAIKAGSFTRPHIVICIPSGVTEVERRAVEDAAKQAGASRVELILEPIAAGCPRASRLRAWFWTSAAAQAKRRSSPTATPSWQIPSVWQAINLTQLSFRTCAKSTVCSSASALRRT